MSAESQSFESPEVDGRVIATVQQFSIISRQVSLIEMGLASAPTIKPDELDEAIRISRADAKPLPLLAKEGGSVAPGEGQWTGYDDNYDTTEGNRPGGGAVDFAFYTAQEDSPYPFSDIECVSPDRSPFAGSDYNLEFAARSLVHPGQQRLSLLPPGIELDLAGWTKEEKARIDKYHSWSYQNGHSFETLRAYRGALSRDGYHPTRMSLTGEGINWGLGLANAMPNDRLTHIFINTTGVSDETYLDLVTRSTKTLTGARADMLQMLRKHPNAFVTILLGGNKFDHLDAQYLLEELDAPLPQGVGRPQKTQALLTDNRYPKSTYNANLHWAAELYAFEREQ